MTCCRVGEGAENTQIRSSVGDVAGEEGGVVVCGLLRFLQQVFNLIWSVDQNVL